MVLTMDFRYVRELRKNDSCFTEQFSQRLKRRLSQACSCVFLARGCVQMTDRSRLMMRTVLVIVMMMPIASAGLPTAGAQGTWTPVTSPTTHWLVSISMASATEGWAVGYSSGGEGTMLHYSGGSWSTVTSPTSPAADLTSVFMVSASDGWAVGAVGGLGVILHYSGGSWSTVTSPTSNCLYSVFMVSASDGWAVGTGGTIIHYSGGSWSTVTSPTGVYLNSVFMLSASEGWAVGGLGVILHYSGGSWSTVTSPVTGDLQSVFMVSPSDGWIVPGILHYDGGSWSIFESQGSLSSVDMVSATDGWAVGSGGKILHYVAVQATMIVSYAVSGGGSPTPPTFNYVQGGASKTYTLTSTPTPITVDDGSSWSVTPNPLAGSTSTNRWMSNQPLSGTASTSTVVFTFYSQMLCTISYEVVGRGSGFSPPTFTGDQFGVSSPRPLTTTPTGYWYDSGSSWTVTNPLSGSTGSEQWITSQSTSGTMSSAQTIAFSYRHQYYLTMLAGTGGSVTPLSGWQDAGASVTVNAVPDSGFIFTSWTGSGAGSASYSGTKNPATFTMKGPITETANFDTLSLTVTLVSPSDGASVSANKAVRLKVKVTSSGSVQGTTVTIYVDGTPICSDVTGQNGALTCSFTPTLPAHTYSWYATASKNGHAPGTSQTWTFIT
jgi:hypothetical protein